MSFLHDSTDLGSTFEVLELETDYEVIFCQYRDFSSCPSSPLLSLVKMQKNSGYLVPPACIGVFETF